MVRLLKFLACLLAAGVCLVAGCNPPFDNYFRPDLGSGQGAPMSVVQSPD